jgi:hypothetical protein
MVALLAVTTPAAASAQPLTPLIVNWQEFFQVEWEVSQRAGHPLLTGYVRSVWKYGARWMQILVDRVDASGALIDQRLVWLPSSVPSRSQVYFEVRVEPAASYRVAVFAYELPDRP